MHSLIAKAQLIDNGSGFNQMLCYYGVLALVLSSTGHVQYVDYTVWLFKILQPPMAQSLLQFLQVRVMKYNRPLEALIIWLDRGTARVGLIKDTV